MGEVERSVGLAGGNAQQLSRQVQFAAVQTVVLAAKHQGHLAWPGLGFQQPLQSRLRQQVLPLFGFHPP